jgi:hypothetical protein
LSIISYMQSLTLQPWPGRIQWSLAEKILFRFIFIYFLLYTAPWTWILDLPGVSYISQYYYMGIDWLVNFFNAKIFKTYKELVPLNGSGDTSFGWTQVKMNLVLAAVGMVIWTITDLRARNYNGLSYLLRVVLRYTLIIALLSYGIIKIFGLQMIFPSLSQLATPLGDLLPMRLSWLFVGYSDSYQAFSGVMEVMAGILLFFRRTSAFGAVVAAAVFANVVMLNLSYDIPVKLYSIHLFVMSVILIIYEYKRLLPFLFNKTVAPSQIYEVRFSKKWVRILRFVMKYVFIGFNLVMGIIQGYQGWSQSKAPRKEVGSIKSGMYDVTLFAINSDTIPYSPTDSLRWKDVVFDHGGGSVNTTDNIFWQRYRRGYFRYSVDSTGRNMTFTKSGWTGQTDSLFTLQFDQPDSNSLRLWGQIRKDSVYVIMKKNNRHFQLTEKQFHWLSEYNR